MANRFISGKRLLLAAVVIIPIVTIIVLMYLCSFNAPTTVIVLRHAEKDTSSNLPDEQVPLTPDGVTRARALAEVLERSGVSAIYVTQMLRTQQTAEPLATSRGITAIQYNYNLGDGDHDGVDDGVNGIIAEVLSRRNRGGVIVIVGHNDSVPQIIAGLGGGTVTVGNEFDNLFVLTLDSWTRTAHLIKATYGAPS